MCLWYASGNCSHGAVCRFSHSEAEVRKHDDDRLRAKPISLRSTSTESSNNFDFNSMSPQLSPHFSPSSVATAVPSPMNPGLLSLNSSTSTSLDELDCVADTSNEARSSLCNVCGLATDGGVVLPDGCFCKMFEDCSELLRLL